MDNKMKIKDNIECIFLLDIMRDAWKEYPLRWKISIRLACFLFKGLFDLKITEEK